MPKLTIEVESSVDDMGAGRGHTRISVDGKPVGLLHAFDFSATASSALPEMTAHVISTPGLKNVGGEPIDNAAVVALLKTIPGLTVIEVDPTAVAAPVAPAWAEQREP